MAQDQPARAGHPIGVQFILEDGEQRHLAAPESFPIPSAAQRARLRPGDLAKLIFRITHDGTVDVERMWVRVDHVLPPDPGHASGHYLGTLDNRPVCTGEFGPGTIVRFHARHVIGIWADDQ
jgi:hypothetical protein